MISRIGLEQAYDNIKFKNEAFEYSGDANMTYNLLDYGAVPDGNTDNTIAFTSAFKAA